MSVSRIGGGLDVEHLEVLSANNVYELSSSGRIRGKPVIVQTELSDRLLEAMNVYDQTEAQEHLERFPLGSYPRSLVIGNALSSHLVDYLHGTLPDHQDDGKLKRRLGDLLSSLLDRAESRVALVDVIKATLQQTDDNANVKSLANHFLWHEVCSLRRILSRILIATNPTLVYESRAACEDMASLPSTILSRLETVRSQLNGLVLARAERTFTTIQSPFTDSNKEPIKVEWNELAVLYEATLILRSRGNVALAASYASRVITATRVTDLSTHGASSTSIEPELTHRFDEQSYLPSSGSVIDGMIAFNPQLFTGKSGVHCYIEAAKTLFGISLGITNNSNGASMDGLRDSTITNTRSLMENWMATASKFMTNTESFAPSSYLHIESTLRVLALNIFLPRNLNDSKIPNDGKGSEKVEDILINMLVQIYMKFEEVLSKSELKNTWMNRTLLGKIQQDAGMLFSNITPVYIVREPSKGVDSKVHQKVLEMIEQGWDDPWDCPVRLTNELQQASFADIINRSKSPSRPQLRELTKWIGDPNSLNPLNSSQFTQFLWRQDRNSPATPDDFASMHLKHFPQGAVNKAQISLIMAYMQALTAHRNNGNDQCLFGTIQENLRYSEKGWVLSDRNPKPQFTLGYVSEPGEKKIKKHLAASGKTPNFRAYLKRVNRMDSLMYLATSLNLVEELISVSSNKRSSNIVFNDAARNCKPLPFKQIDGQPIHVHDIIHAGQEIGQSPMWISTIDQSITGEKSSLGFIVGELLRAAAVRLSLLTLRVEQLSRALLKERFREPYHSSSILILDQSRVLIKYLISDFKSSIREQEKAISGLPIPKVSREHFNHLNTHFTKNKGHQGVQFDSSDYKDRNHASVIPINDLALNYLASMHFSNSAEMVEFIETLHGRLEFNKTIGEEWTVAVADAIFRRATEEIHEEREVDEINAINEPPSSPLEEGQTSNEEAPPVGPADEELISAYQEIFETTNREWILWARLVFFPLCINGRILQSGTTFAELNNHEIPTKSKNPEPPTGRSLLWGQILEAYKSPFDDQDFTV